MTRLLFSTSVEYSLTFGIESMRFTPKNNKKRSPDGGFKPSTKLRRSVTSKHSGNTQQHYTSLDSPCPAFGNENECGEDLYLPLPSPDPIRSLSTRLSPSNTPSRPPKRVRVPTQTPLRSLDTNLGDIHATPLRGEPPSDSSSTAKRPRLTQTHAKASIELILEEQKEAEVEAERERVAAAEREVMRKAVWEKEMAEKIWNRLTAPTDEGGFGFRDHHAFFQALLSGGGDRATQANIQTYLRTKWTDTVNLGFARMDADAKMEYVSAEHAAILRQEGRAIQRLFSRDSDTTMGRLLHDFTVEVTTEELKKVAPMLWKSLEASAGDTEKRHDYRELVCHFLPSFLLLILNIHCRFSRRSVQCSVSRTHKKPIHFRP
jgi:hypothetical protein